MTRTTIARWRDWSGKGIEHLVLTERRYEIVADSVILGTSDEGVFAARYRILCDASWRARKVESTHIDSDRTAQLASDGLGNWVDGSGTALPNLRGAIDVDISATPFTNTLPIRQLNLQRGRSEEIVAVYFQVPDLAITTDRQRYTCLETGRRYRYESIGSDFTREIEVDDQGLAVTYPGLFRRVL